VVDLGNRPMNNVRYGSPATSSSSAGLSSSFVRYPESVYRYRYRRSLIVIVDR
jgi:hypothetical protein